MIIITITLVISLVLAIACAWILYKLTEITGKNCKDCGCVPIPDEDYCPECMHPNPEEASDPFTQIIRLTEEEIEMVNKNDFILSLEKTPERKIK